MQIYYIPCPDAATAEKISSLLLNEKLIACANILAPMQSMYWWKGKIESSAEVPLLLKTDLDGKGLQKIESRLAALHPYETPCFVRLDPESINSGYLAWIRESLR